MTPLPFFVALSLSCVALPVWGQAPVKPIQPLSGKSSAPSASAPVPSPVKAPPKASPQTTSSAAAKTGSPVATPAEPMKYVVKVGDNPWKIAKNHGISVDELLQANKIRDSRKLGIGDILLLPAGVESKGVPDESGETAPEVAAAATAQVAAAGDGWELYTVKSGDNPWSIARQLKLDHQKILSLNKGLDFTKLKIGQQIKVPKN